MWDDAIHAAADTYKNKYPDFQFVSSDESIRRWNMEHAAQLITRCTDEQYNALKALIRTATETDGATPDKLARSIRPLIGLNEPQARANQRYYNTLIANDVPREIAEQRRKLYTEQQLQYRAQMIARTELAASYNGGHYLSVLQAQRQGLMGECKRIWRTADTERTCSYCAALDGTEVGMEEDFIFTHGRQTTSVTTPPAHPHCMCTVSYEEIAPQIQQNEQNTGFTNEENHSIIEERNMAMGLRQPSSHILTDDEIISIKEDAKALGINESILRFNYGNRTGFSDKSGLIHIRGDILPDLTSKVPRDRMSSRAVLAHEYFGHFTYHPSNFKPGDWRDEFRASYQAAINAPNLTNEDRAYLMLDAYGRASESGVYIRYNEKARKIIYGI